MIRHGRGRRRISRRCCCLPPATGGMAHGLTHGEIDATDRGSRRDAWRARRRRTAGGAADVRSDGARARAVSRAETSDRQQLSGKSGNRDGKSAGGEANRVRRRRRGMGTSACPRDHRAAECATRLQQAAVSLGDQRPGRAGAHAALARLLVLRGGSARLGLARLRLAYVGAAPVPAEVRRWATALGITIQQIDAHRAASRMRRKHSYRALQAEAYST